jgi:hypothetical protein
LERDGAGAEGRYRNTAETATFLDKRGPMYIGGILEMALNMLIEFGDALDYTGADFAGWCRNVGFQGVEIVPLTGPASAGIAYK